MDIPELLELAKSTARLNQKLDCKLPPNSYPTTEDWAMIDNAAPIRVGNENIGRQADIIRYPRDVPYYAIKRYSPNDKDIFYREKGILYSTSKHPHPFLLQELYCDVLRYSIITRWYHRGTLTEWIVNPDLDADDVAVKLSILIGIASALDHLHEVCHITHEDIKTDNIMVIDSCSTTKTSLLTVAKIDDDNHPLIIDFGLSVNHKDKYSHRQAGCHGTGPFIAPEVFQNANQVSDEGWKRVDIYALGIVMFCMAAIRVV